MIFDRNFKLTCQVCNKTYYKLLKKMPTRGMHCEECTRKKMIGYQSKFYQKVRNKDARPYIKRSVENMSKEQIKVVADNVKKQRSIQEQLKTPVICGDNVDAIL